MTAAVERVRGAVPTGGTARAAGLVLLFLAGAGFSLLTILKGMQPNDEGLMLQAASRIAAGEVPYKDFWWFYPPGQPYLLAVLWKLFGPSLLTWRILRVLVNAAVALLAYVLARRMAPRPLALVAWLASIVVLAAPTGPHPYPVAMAFALGCLLLFDRNPALAGVLTGLTGFWRIEFAAYLGLAVLVGYALRPGDHRARDALRFVGAALGMAFVLYAPVVFAAGLGDSWDLLIRYPIEDFSKYQSLPFPLHYPGGYDWSGPRAAVNTVSALLNYYQPLVLVIGLGAAILTLALRFRRERWRQVTLAVFAVGMFHYLVTRPDPFHTSPLAVMLSVLGVWLVADSLAAPSRTGRLGRLSLVPARGGGREPRVDRRRWPAPDRARGAGRHRARAPGRGRRRERSAPVHLLAARNQARADLPADRPRAHRGVRARTRAPRHAHLRGHPPLRSRDLGRAHPLRAGRPPERHAL